MSLDSVINAETWIRAHWPMAESSGTSATEQVTGVAGTYVSPSAYLQGGPGGNGVQFGSGGYFKSDAYTSDGGIQGSGVAFEFWFKIASYPAAGTFGALCSVGTDIPGADFDNILSLRDDGVLYFMRNVATDGILVGATTTDPVSLNTWHHVFVNRPGGPLNPAGGIWLDGAQVGTFTDAHGGGGVGTGQNRFWLGTARSYSMPTSGTPIVYHDHTAAFAEAAYYYQWNTTATAVPHWNLGTQAMSGARSTEFVGEVLRSGGGNARSTEFVAEVLRDGSPQARLTEMVCEILRTTQVGVATDVGATTAFEIGVHVSPTAVTGAHMVAAYTGIDIGAVAPPTNALDILISHETSRQYHYPLDDESGTVAHEEHNFRAGTYRSGTVTYRVTGPNGASAVQFSGGAYMDRQDAGSGVGGTSTSIEFWFKLDAYPTAESGLFSMWDSNRPTIHIQDVTVGVNGLLTYRVGAQNGYSVATFAPTNLALGEWHQMWIAYGSAGGGGTTPWAWYLDGQLLSTGASPNGDTSWNRISLGKDTGAHGVTTATTGSYSELVIYGGGTAIPASRAQAHWATGGGVLYAKAAHTGFNLESQTTQRSVFQITKTATTGLQLWHNASYPRLVSATTRIDVGQGSTGRIAIVRTASTGLVMGSAGTSRKNAAGRATTGLTMLPSARNPFNPNVFVTATTGVNAGTSTDFDIDRVYSLNADTRVLIGTTPTFKKSLVIAANTGIRLVNDAFGHNTIQRLSASTVFEIGTEGDGHVPQTYEVSAASGFTVAYTDTVRTNFVRVAAATILAVGASSKVTQVLAALFVHATTEFLVETQGRRSATFSWEVAAATAFEIGEDADKGTYRSYRLRAASEVTLGLDADVVVRRVYRNSAATGVRFINTASDVRLRGYVVTAQAGLLLGTVARSVKAAVAAGTTGLAVGLDTPRPGRIFHVTAITAMGMGRGEDSNEFIHVPTTTTGFELRLIATKLKVGTPGGTGLEFTHRADAEVWLEWRLADLQLAPGGQLPH